VKPHKRRGRPSSKAPTQHTAWTSHRLYCSFFHFHFALLGRARADRYLFSSGHAMGINTHIWHTTQRLQVLYTPSDDTVLWSLMPGFSRFPCTTCRCVQNWSLQTAFPLFGYPSLGHCHLPQQELLIIPYRSFPLVAAQRGRVHHAGTIILSKSL